MAMKPMLFSTPMVQAILDGRKTQTRRVIKPQPPKDAGEIYGPKLYTSIKVDKNGFEQPGPEVYGIYGDDWGCELPYQPGDILWVRETWNFITCEKCKKSEDYSDFSPGCVVPLSDRNRYKDEYGCFVYCANYRDIEDDIFPPDTFKWHPSIHMPKEAARLFLLVENARIERLQAITEEDARAEGCITFQDKIDNEKFKNVTEFDLTARDAFAELWDSLYAKRRFPFESNPWVEVTTFRKISKEVAYASGQ